MQDQTLIRGFTTRFCFTELTFGSRPKLTKRSRASTFQITSARLSNNHTNVTFASDTSFPRHTSTSCHWKLRNWGGFQCRFLCTIVTLMPETALVSLRTLASFFPLTANTSSSFNAYWSLAILDNCSSFDSPVPGVRVSQSKVSDLYSFSSSSSISYIWASTSLNESRCRSFRRQFWVAQTHIFSICADFPRNPRTESLT